jgi:hypothetical protein
LPLCFGVRVGKHGGPNRTGTTFAKGSAAALLIDGPKFIRRKRTIEKKPGIDARLDSLWMEFVRLRAVERHCVGVIERTLQRLDNPCGKPQVVR